MNNPSIPESEILLHRWGWSRFLFTGETVSIAQAWGQEGGASSLHLHKHKDNSFLVLSGRVELQGPNGSPIVSLAAGHAYTVVAGVLHRMVFPEDAILHELYQAVAHQVIDLDDIEREDDGWVPGGGPSRRLG